MKLGKLIVAAVALMAVFALAGCPSPARPGAPGIGVNGDNGDNGDIEPPPPPPPPGPDGTLLVDRTTLDFVLSNTAGTTLPAASPVTVLGSNLNLAPGVHVIRSASHPAVTPPAPPAANVVGNAVTGGASALAYALGSILIDADGNGVGTLEVTLLAAGEAYLVASDDDEDRVLTINLGGASANITIGFLQAPRAAEPIVIWSLADPDFAWPGIGNALFQGAGANITAPTATNRTIGVERSAGAIDNWNGFDIRTGWFTANQPPPTADFPNGEWVILIAAHFDDEAASIADGTGFQFHGSGGTPVPAAPQLTGAAPMFAGRMYFEPFTTWPTDGFRLQSSPGGAGLDMTITYLRIMWQPLP